MQQKNREKEKLIGRIKTDSCQSFRMRSCFSFQESQCAPSRTRCRRHLLRVEEQGVSEHILSSGTLFSVPRAELIIPSNKIIFVFPKPPFFLQANLRGEGIFFILLLKVRRNPSWSTTNQTVCFSVVSLVTEWTAVWLYQRILIGLPFNHHATGEAWINTFRA